MKSLLNLYEGFGVDQQINFRVVREINFVFFLNAPMNFLRSPDFQKKALLSEHHVPPRPCPIPRTPF